jgi:hypothetical protein
MYTYIYVYMILIYVCIYIDTYIFIIIEIYINKCTIVYRDLLSVLHSQRLGKAAYICIYIHRYAYIQKIICMNVNVPLKEYIKSYIFHIQLSIGIYYQYYIVSDWAKLPIVEDSAGAKDRYHVYMYMFTYIHVCIMCLY